MDVFIFGVFQHLSVWGEKFEEILTIAIGIGIEFCNGVPLSQVYKLL
jgi:hypothetical protein